LIALFGVVLAGLVAQAHFVFVVPDKAGAAATVVFSEDLESDDGVAIAKINGLKLTLRDAAGKDIPVTHKAEEYNLAARLPGSGPRIVYGSINYGVLAKGEAPPFLLAYHPKAVIGAVPADKLVIGDKLPAELVPVAEKGSIRFKLLGRGKPVADADVTVLKPDRTKAKVKTGKDGLTEAVEGSGRYGAWARYTEAKPGEHDGKKYTEVRHYATLVVDTAATASAVPPLPVAVSSFGAASAGKHVYVYGGHSGKTHVYSTRTTVSTFRRLNLADTSKGWEELPGGPHCQGTALVAHNGTLIRIGGMQPRNAPGTESDNHSLASVARFDPKVGKWEDLPEMPAGRSSHDAVVVGDTLVVAGGWKMNGTGKPSEWHDTALLLDLSKPGARWESVPQPFKRRALTAAVLDGKVHILCGLTAEAGTSHEVNIFDLATRQWTTGPKVPGDRMNGFTPTAAVLAGKLYLSPADGNVYRLDGDAWETVAKLERPRFVHRVVPIDGKLLVLGGASKIGNVAACEVIVPESAKASTTGN
jgi:N-acetylneuraminic acid mutarotase